MRDAAIDWSRVNRVLVVRLRSIGDTVLSTPSLIALRRFLPSAQIDILLEDWVAPVLEGFPHVDNILAIDAGAASRFTTARQIRRSGYDVVFNLHGGTTATFLTFASGARHRVGYQNYQYSFLYNHRLASPEAFWHRDNAHSAEQQLALLGFVGVPVVDRPRSELAIGEAALRSLQIKFRSSGLNSSSEVGPLAVLHPTAAYKTKEWATDKFARTAEFLKSKGFSTIAVGSENQRDVLAGLQSDARVPIHTFSDLTIPELVALASRARIFVGNDSGVAHIAAAVRTPSVIVFGSSNRDHWGPWTDAPSEMVFEPFSCQPCAGRTCLAFGEPRCILTLPEEKVFAAIERVLSMGDERGQ